MDRQKVAACRAPRRRLKSIFLRGLPLYLPTIVGLDLLRYEVIFSQIAPQVSVRMQYRL